MCPADRMSVGKCTGSVQLIECLLVNDTGSVQLIECLDKWTWVCAAERVSVDKWHWVCAFSGCELSD